MENEWQNEHSKVIDNFLDFLNKNTRGFILKRGTALAKCYNLNRFSEDIDLDAIKEDIKPRVKQFCILNEFKFRVAKDTSTVKRCFVNYGNESRPLKIEVSYRRKEINPSEYTQINNIQVYNINRLAQMKALAYSSRDKIRDLYDLSFICDKYFENLNEQTVLNIKDALEFKGLEHFDYITNTQEDSLIDNNKLLNNFLQMYEKIGLLDDDIKKKEQELFIKIIKPILLNKGNLKVGIKQCKEVLPHWDNEKLKQALTNLYKSLGLEEKKIDFQR